MFSAFLLLPDLFLSSAAKERVDHHAPKVAAYRRELQHFRGSTFVL
jgi:hypothetical protein